MLGAPGKMTGMRPWKLTVVSALAGVIPLLTVALPARAMPLDRFFVLSADEEARVKRGDIVVHMGQGADHVTRMYVTGLVDAPIDETFRAYTDFPHYHQIFDNLHDSTVVASASDQVTIRFGVDLPWPVGYRWTRNVNQMDPANHVVTFWREDGSFTAYEGRIRLEREGPDRTRVLYLSRVEAGVALPPWLVDQLAASTAPVLVGKIRDHIKRWHDAGVTGPLLDGPATASTPAGAANPATGSTPPSP